MCKNLAQFGFHKHEQSGCPLKATIFTGSYSGRITLDIVMEDG
jgi:hypothetical protein